MKHFLSLVLILAAVSFAAAPSYTAVDAGYEMKRVGTVAAAYDTLSGASDSVVLWSNFKWDDGCEYMLVRGPITGTGSDSVKIALQVIVEDEIGTQLYTAAVDSFAAAAGEVCLLGLNGAVIGIRGDIRLRTYADNGGQVILPKFELWRRKPIVTQSRSN